MKNKDASIQEEILQQIKTILNLRSQNKPHLVTDHLISQESAGTHRLNILTFTLEVESHWGLTSKE